MSDAPAILKFRSGQKEFMRGVDRHGITGFLARRQYGKTTMLAAIAMKKMMKQRDHTIIFGSVKLSLGGEVVRKESHLMRATIGALRAEDGQLRMVEQGSEKKLDGITDDLFDEIFASSKFEFRYYHDRTSYSRTKVVALEPDTVGETGDLICDEISRKKNWPEVWEAIEPIAQSNPNFRVIFATTPSPDDAHLSNEMLVPPVGTDLPVNPQGNWYRTDFGIWVLRVDAFDAYADGVPVYDLETREPLDPTEHRRRANDKDSWDRNYGCKFVLGGTSAVGVVQLNSAQTRGVGQCAFFLCEEDGDFERALDFVAAHVSEGKIGLGWDLATTEKEASNPSSFTVTEDIDGLNWKGTATIAWKTADPDIALARAKAIVQVINMRPKGGRARGLAIDATNERYFAVRVQRVLSALVPVELVIASETVEQPGSEPITKKALLGNQLAADINENRATLPPEKYIKEDFRRVKRDRGSFACEMGPNGEHGDTFDSQKLSLYKLRGGASGAISAETIAKIRIGGARTAHTPLFLPKRLA
jgi:hypothetical protein